MVAEKLKEFGLSEKEVKIYLALLKLGACIVRDIAKESGIKRSTVYVILESLLKRGLVSIIERRGAKLYNPAPPEELIRHLEATVKKYTAFVDAARTLLPEMQSLKQREKEQKENDSKPRIKLFEGQEGVRTVYKDTLASLETIRAYASLKNTGTKPIVSKYPQPTQREIKAQIIFSDTPEARKQIARSKEEARNAFSVHKERHGFSSEINIYDNKVIFISPLGKFALIIESRELANILKKAFESSREEIEQTDKNLFFESGKIAGRPA